MTSRDNVTSRDECEQEGEIKIVLEWVKCIKTLDTLLDQHLLITNNNLQKKLFTFNSGGLDKLSQVLRGWARLQKSELADTPLGIFIVPNTRSVVYPTVTLELWTRYLDKSGVLADMRHVKRLVYEGGVSDEARGEVWRCLLSLHHYSHSHRQRSYRNQLLQDKYRRLKDKVPTVDTDPDHYALFTTAVTDIEKDCHRTSSNNPQVAGSHNPNQAVLKRILINYCLHRPEIGYVQGLSDLLVPVFLVIREESDVFWCFDNLVNRSPFSKVQYCSLYHQLAFLREVLGLLHPEIYTYLSTTEDALTLTCCHRWFLLLFKREFCAKDLLLVWDAILAAPSPFFQVFISAAMISLYFPPLISQHISATDLLIKTHQQLALQYKLGPVVKQARQLYQDVLKLPQVPCSLIPLVGLPGNTRAGLPGNVLQSCPLDGQEEWDAFRNPNFSCVECQKNGSCRMKREYFQLGIT